MPIEALPGYEWVLDTPGVSLNDLHKAWKEGGVRHVARQPQAPVGRQVVVVRAPQPDTVEKRVAIEKQVSPEAVEAKQRSRAHAAACSKAMSAYVVARRAGEEVDLDDLLPAAPIEAVQRGAPLFLKPEADSRDTAGRRLEGMIVPYGVGVLVRDRPERKAYLERFSQGAFAAACLDPHGVVLDIEHQSGTGFGVGIHLEEHSDGLWGRFWVNETAVANRALNHIRRGEKLGLSIDAFAHSSMTTIGGAASFVQRATLHRVALCERPAYGDARVTLVRF
jgi:HK97 family phage prohead protease